MNNTKETKFKTNTFLRYMFTSRIQHIHYNDQEPVEERTKINVNTLSLFHIELSNVLSHIYIKKQKRQRKIKYILDDTESNIFRSENDAKSEAEPP